jgi:hypothetical protein
MAAMYVQLPSCTIAAFLTPIPFNPLCGQATLPGSLRIRDLGS